MNHRPILPGNSPGRRHGFTLIEVMLSLGLAALVLMALATAVDVHLRCLQIGRTHAEEAQLARALLYRIGDDLRNAAVINPVDSTKIPAAPASDTESSELGGGGAPAADDMEMEEFAADLGLEDEYVIGLYGESNWMDVDVRRTPRLDQYDYETLPSGSEILPDRVSAVKTVSYSLGPDTGLASVTGDYRGGLMRREIDRAVTRWADDTGTLASADLELEPIAPEVTDMEFLYFDGTQWVDAWDSTEMGGLPIAVHVSLAIMPRDQFNRFLEAQSNSSIMSEPTDSFIYSLTVALPVAEGDVSGAETTEESGEVDMEETTESE